jgi:hypothetical protein
MTAQGVEFLSDGRTAWRKIQPWGSLLRKRGLTATAILALASSGTPWWLDPNFFTNTIDIKFSYKALFLLSWVPISLLTLCGLFYLRKRFKRSLDLKFKLHDFEHYLRDAQTGFFEIANANDWNIDKYNGEFQALITNIGQKTKDYFHRLCRDDSIEVAIRLATKGEDGFITYNTVTRTSGLSRSRQKTTKNININEGIPHFFQKYRNCTGVLHYTDIEAAIKIGAFKKTPNEEHYSEEIITMLVAPLNAWEGTKQSLIGLLYITSRNKKTFSLIHTDSALFIADMIAKAIAFAISIQERFETNQGGGDDN